MVLGSRQMHQADLSFSTDPAVPAQLPSNLQFPLRKVQTIDGEVTIGDRSAPRKSERNDPSPSSPIRSQRVGDG